MNTPTPIPGDVHIPGERHAARVWLRGGPPEGFITTFDFGDQPLTHRQAMTSAEVGVIQAKLAGGVDEGQRADGKTVLTPFGRIEGGGAFLWAEVVAVRYEGKFTPEKKIELPDATALRRALR